MPPAPRCAPTIQRGHVPARLVYCCGSSARALVPSPPSKCKDLLIGVPARVTISPFSVPPSQRGSPVTSGSLRLILGAPLPAWFSCNVWFPPSAWEWSSDYVSASFFGSWLPVVPLRVRLHHVFLYDVACCPPLLVGHPRPARPESASLTKLFGTSWASMLPTNTGRPSRRNPATDRGGTSQSTSKARTHGKREQLQRHQPGHTPRLLRPREEVTQPWSKPFETGHWYNAELWRNSLQPLSKTPARALELRKPAPCEKGTRVEPQKPGWVSGVTKPSEPADQPRWATDGGTRYLREGSANAEPDPSTGWAQAAGTGHPREGLSQKVMKTAIKLNKKTQRRG